MGPHACRNVLIFSGSRRPRDLLNVSQADARLAHVLLRARLTSLFLSSRGPRESLYYVDRVGKKHRSSYFFFVKRKFEYNI